MFRFIVLFLGMFSSVLYGELYIGFHTLGHNGYGGKYEFRPRLGNQMMNMFKAFALAKRLDATLVLMPCDIDYEIAVQKKIKTISFKDFVRIKRFKKVKRCPKSNCLDEPVFFISPRYVKQEDIKNIDKPSFKEVFKEILFEACPGFIPFKKDKSITIAVHIRTGDNFDYPLYSQQFYDKTILDIQKAKPGLAERTPGRYLDILRPTKAPPLQFYVDSMDYFLKNVSSDVEFYIFTDYQDKNHLINMLKDKISIPIDIKPYKGHYENEFEQDLNDMLVMSTMDGIIRPRQSTFSVVSAYLANYSYHIYPMTHRWEGDCLVMNLISYSDLDREEVLCLYD